MNTRDLEAFLAVVETGSIVGAAARLCLTQSGVSRRIQSLEEALGVLLLDRQSKPLKPTPAGRDTYAHGRGVVRAMDELRSSLGEADTGRQFRIGVTPQVSEPALAEPLDATRRSHPGLTLCVTTGWQEPLLAQVQRGEIDVAAFCMAEGLAPPATLQCSAFGLQELVVVAALDAGVSRRPTLAELSRHPWVLNPDGCGFRSSLRRQFEDAGLALRVSVEALGAELRLSLVARGLGLGLTTASALAGSAWRAQLRRVEAKAFESRVQAWLVHRELPTRLVPPLAVFQASLHRAMTGKRAKAAPVR